MIIEAWRNVENWAPNSYLRMGAFSYLFKYCLQQVVATWCGPAQSQSPESGRTGQVSFRAGPGAGALDGAQVTDKCPGVGGMGGKRGLGGSGQGVGGAEGVREGSWRS